MVLDDETLRLESIDMVTREEQRHSPTIVRDYMRKNCHSFQSKFSQLIYDPEV